MVGSSTSHRKRYQTDCISHLPDSIIHHIFSFLPTKYAIRTSLLSKRWRSVWTTCPTLAFSLSSSNASAFASFVDTALILYSSSHLEKFHLDFPLVKKLRAKLDLWLRFATARRVRHLSLKLHKPDKPTNLIYYVPHFFFLCSSLVDLQLSSCNIDPRKTISWSSLRSLSIRFAQLGDEAIKHVFAGSPVLEFVELRDFKGITQIEIFSTRMRELVIHSCLNDSPLEISAPYLKTLRVRGQLSNKLRLIGPTSVVEAELNFNIRRDDHEDPSDNFKRLREILIAILQKLHSATIFRVGSWCLEVLSFEEVGGCQLLFPNCESLILNTEVPTEGLLFALKMMLGSLHLGELAINMILPPTSCLSEFARNFDETFLEVFEKLCGALKDSDCLAQHLRRVDMGGLDPNHSSLSNELLLAKHILENALVLEKMVISANKVSCIGAVRYGKLLGVAHSLLRCTRACVSARVIFHHNC